MTNRVEFYAPDQTADNIYAVPIKLWNSWLPPARIVFNEQYGIMKDNQDAVTPRRGFYEGWDTISFNSACIAANAVNRWLHV